MGLQERLRKKLRRLIPKANTLTGEEKEEASFTALTDVLHQLANSGHQGAQRIKTLLYEQKIAIVTYNTIKTSKFGEIPGLVIHTDVDPDSQTATWFLVINTSLVYSSIGKKPEVFGEFLTIVSKRIYELYLQGVRPRVFDDEEKQEMALVAASLIFKAGFEVR